MAADMVRPCERRERLNATPSHLVKIGAAAADHGPSLEREKPPVLDSVSLPVPLTGGLVCSHVRVAVDEMPPSTRPLTPATIAATLKFRTLLTRTRMP